MDLELRTTLHKTKRPLLASTTATNSPEETTSKTTQTTK